MWSPARRDGLGPRDALAVREVSGCRGTIRGLALQLPLPGVECDRRHTFFATELRDRQPALALPLHPLSPLLVQLRIELGADDICSPCRHNLGGLCDDTIDTSFRPRASQSKREWNLRIDRRWCQRLGLQQDDGLTAREFCLLIRERWKRLTERWGDGKIDGENSITNKIIIVGRSLCERPTMGHEYKFLSD